MSARIFKARHAMGPTVRGIALVASDGFSARYDLDRIKGIFSRPSHKLAGQSYVGKILVLDTAKGGVATAWMLHDMKARGIVPLALVLIRSIRSWHRAPRSAMSRCSPDLTRISPRPLQAAPRWKSSRHRACSE